MKKLIFFLISFLMVINGVGASEKEQIYIGDKIPGMYIRKIDASGKITNKQGGFLRRASDNHFVYCLEPFVLLIDNFEYQEYSDNYLELLNISKETWEEITLIAYYGYMYNDHTEDYWYYVTQMMIWRVVDKNAQFYFTDTLGGAINESLYKEEIAEINSLVKMHKTLPKISDISINYGEEIVISDENNVINNYQVISSDMANINGNNLIIKGNKLGNYTINLVRKSTYYNDSLLVYIDSTSQTVMHAGNVPDKEYSFNISVSGGKIIVNKKDYDTLENLKIPGIKFSLYDASNNLVDTLVTNEEGIVIFDDLPVGTYYLSEDNDQEILGYIINNEVIKINITDQKEVNIDFYNKEVTGSIKIIKYKEVFDQEITLVPGENIEFGLYDMSNNLIMKKSTNEEGILIFDNLKIGKYKIKELSNNTSYINNEHYIEMEVKLTINNAGSEEIVKITNELKKGSIKVLKYKELESNDFALAKGVEIGLYDKDKNLIKVLTTNELGEVIFDNIPIGIYYVKELSEFIEYRTNDKFYKVNVTEEVEERELEIFNYLKKGKLIIKKIGDNYLPLEDTEFSIYANNGTQIGNYRTDNNGEIIVSDLPLGDYYLKETKASSGYQILNDKIYFKILEDEEVITINVTNKKIVVKVPNTGIEFEEIILFIRKKRFKLN